VERGDLDSAGRGDVPGVAGEQLGVELRLGPDQPLVLGRLAQQGDRQRGAAVGGDVSVGLPLRLAEMERELAPHLDAVQRRCGDDARHNLDLGRLSSERPERHLISPRSIVDQAVRSGRDLGEVGSRGKSAPLRLRSEAREGEGSESRSR
jgi:hypothetical protein